MYKKNNDQKLYEIFFCKNLTVFVFRNLQKHTFDYFFFIISRGFFLLIHPSRCNSAIFPS